MAARMDASDEKEKFDNDVETILKSLLEKEKEAGINGQKIVWCFIYKTLQGEAGVIRLSLSSEGTLSDYGIDVKHDAHDTKRYRREGIVWTPIKHAIENGLLPVDWGIAKQTNEIHSEWSTILAQYELVKNHFAILDDQKRQAYIEYFGEEIVMLYHQLLEELGGLARAGRIEEIEKEIATKRAERGWNPQISAEADEIKNFISKKGKKSGKDVYRKMAEKTWASQFSTQLDAGLEGERTRDIREVAAAAADAAGVPNRENWTDTLINQFEDSTSRYRPVESQGIVFDHGTDQTATDDAPQISGFGDGIHIGEFYDGKTSNKMREPGKNVYPSEDQYEFCGQAVFVVGGERREEEKDQTTQWGDDQEEWHATKAAEQAGYTHAGDIGLIGNTGKHSFGPLSNKQFKKRKGPDFILYVLGNKLGEEFGMRGKVLIKPPGEEGSGYPFTKINSTIRGVAANEWYNDVIGIDQKPYSLLKDNQELTAIIKYFADRSHGTAPIAKAVLNDGKSITFGTHDRAAWAALSYILAYDVINGVDTGFEPITVKNVHEISVISEIKNAKNLIIPTVLITPHTNIIKDPDIREGQVKNVMMRARTALPIKEIEEEKAPDLLFGVRGREEDEEEGEEDEEEGQEEEEGKKTIRKRSIGRAMPPVTRSDTARTKRAKTDRREWPGLRGGGKRKRRTKKHHKRRTRNGPKKYTKNNKKKGKKQRKYNKKKPKQRKTNRKTHRKNKKLNKNRRKTRRSR